MQDNILSHLSATLAQIGVSIGVLIALAMLAIGEFLNIPDPLAWGLLAGISIGFLILGVIRLRKLVRGLKEVEQQARDMFGMVGDL